MKTLIILTLIITSIYAKHLDTLYLDNHPQNITNKDIKLLRQLETLAYKQANKHHKTINIYKIYKFIKRYKRHIEPTNNIKLIAVGEVGYKSRNSYTTVQRKKGFYSASVRLEIPLIDQKQKRDLYNQELEYNLQILKAVQEYAKAVNEIYNAKEKIRLLRLKAHAWKSETLAGVKYRDQLLQLIENIQQAKEELYNAIATADALKATLLELTTNPDGLKVML